MDSGRHKSVHLLVLLLVITIGQARLSSSDDSDLKGITLKKTNTDYGSQAGNMNQEDNKAPYFVKVKSMHLNVAKPAGSNLQLRCQAAGDPPPNITWYKDGRPVIRQIGDVKYKKYNLEMEYSTSYDTGNYTCIVCNEHGCKNFTYKVSILETNTDYGSQVGNMNQEDNKAPYFVKVKSMHLNVAKPAGSTLQLRCQAAGDPPPDITWYKDGLPVIRQIGDVKYKKYNLEMESSTSYDTGNYTCIVCNEHGCKNFTYKVSIIERVRSRPEIIESDLKNVTVLVNGTATFKCRTTSSDLKPFIQWIKSDPNVTNVCETTIAKGVALQNGIQNADNPESFTINNVTHSDEGWYTCIAGNSLGNTCASAYLTVAHRKK